MSESISLGSDTRLGWRREALVSTPTWPAAAPAQILRLLPLLSGQLNEGVHKQLVTSTASGLGYTDADLVDISPSADVTFQLQYCVEPLLAAALGHMAPTLPEELAPGVYRHIYEIDPQLGTAIAWESPGSGQKVRRGTLAADRGVSVFEERSTMVHQISFAGKREGVTWSVALLGYDVAHDSVVNTPATLAAAQWPQAADVLLWDLTCRIAPFSASVPLDEGDTIGVESWSVTLQNNLAASPGPRTGLHPEEFERHAVPLVGATLLFPHYAEDTYALGWQANTEYMLAFLHTGPAIGSSGYNFQYNLYVPRCTVIEGNPAGLSAAPPTNPVAFNALVPVDAAADFPTTESLSPLIVELVGTEPNHPLLIA